MNGAEPQFTDAVGKPVPRPLVPKVASPINLLNPDRYEFYTFDDSGDLVKRLMTMKEIQSIVANGNGALISDSDSEPASPISLNGIPISSSETRVQDIVNNVQNVLSKEIETKKNSTIPDKFDTPDVSSSWNLILPAIFGNTGDEIRPNRPMPAPINMTPDSEIEEPVRTTKTPPKKKPSKVTIARSTTVAPSHVQDTVESIDLSLLNTVDEVVITTQKPTRKSTHKQTTKKVSSTRPSTTRKPSNAVKTGAPLVKVQPSKRPKPQPLKVNATTTPELKARPTVTKIPTQSTVKRSPATKRRTTTPVTTTTEVPTTTELPTTTEQIVITTSTTKRPRKTTTQR
jgi:hypothetical protein